MAASHLLENFSSQLPDLSQIKLITPNPGMGIQLRKQLNANLGISLLGPDDYTLAEWLDLHFPCPLPILSAPERELQLFELIRQFSNFFGDLGHWQLSESLIRLFDQLSPQQFSFVQNYYQNTAPAEQLNSNQIRLGKEARIVHTLWLAWQEQLESNGVADRASAYQAQLEAAKLYSFQPHEQLVFFGFDDLNAGEWACFNALLKNPQCTAILHSRAGPASKQLQAENSNPFAEFLERVFCATETNTDLTQAVTNVHRRVRRQSASSTTNADPGCSKKLSLLPAANPELEARTVADVIKQAITNHSKIAVICQNRKLVRRLRALLEAEDLVVYDQAGWALSTTRAATVLSRWLDCIEQDFHYLPLLDLLKSGFVAVEPYAVFRLEQDLIRHGSIHSGLESYAYALQQRDKKLAWRTETYEQVSALLQQLKIGSQGIAELRQGLHPASHFLTILIHSLQTLGTAEHLAADDAGQEVLQILQQLCASKTPSDPDDKRSGKMRFRAAKLSWADFRIWISRIFEQARFRPDIDPAQIVFSSLENAANNTFNLLFFVGTNQGFLPSIVAETAPFFTAAVKQQLGLKTRLEIQQLEQQRFVRALNRADQIICSYSLEDQGSPLTLSPWLQRLQNLHEITFNDNLERQLERQKQNVLSEAEQQRINLSQQRPDAAVALELIPDKYSYSRHQRLMDCPYRFFSEDCLRLKPLDEIREKLQKSDFGERVHLCLQAFHTQTKKLPDPFEQTVTAHNRLEAIQKLTTISQKVFTLDLEDNFEHRAWFETWLQTIPAYIDWLIKRTQDWKIQACEYHGKHKLAEDLQLDGRIDRIDINSEQQQALVDYKTGTTPQKSSVESGENVQLPSYALLLEAVQRAEYLKLDNTGVKSEVILGEDELRTLSTDVAQRLIKVKQQLTQQPLPAWKNATCTYCPSYGLCRHQAWSSTR